MSGGVDSAVSALLLKKQGYDVTGVNMRVWEYPEQCDSHAKSCCSPEDIQDAGKSALSLDIPFYVMKMEREFREKVIDRFILDYASRRTPNPCVECNTYIKFGSLFEKARALGIPLIATGHYAKTRLLDNGRWCVENGLDEKKNQAYYLYGLTQDAIASTIFPLGNLTKPEVRTLAAENNIAVAEKKESQEICFIPQNDYRDFLKKENFAFTPGSFRSRNGQLLGEHDGSEKFTIGQRRGLGVSSANPLYVIAVQHDGDVILGEVADTGVQELTVEQINFQGMDPEKFIKDFSKQPFRCRIQIRYRSRPTAAEIQYLGYSVAASWNGSPEGHRIHVRMLEEVHSAAPGQSAVFYPEEEDSDLSGIVLAGGLIAL